MIVTDTPIVVVLLVNNVSDSSSLDTDLWSAFSAEPSDTTSLLGGVVGDPVGAWLPGEVGIDDGVLKCGIRPVLLSEEERLLLMIEGVVLEEEEDGVVVGVVRMVIEDSDVTVEGGGEGEEEDTTLGVDVGGGGGCVCEVDVGTTGTAGALGSAFKLDSQTGPECGRTK